MLNKRVQVLFDQDDYVILEGAAKMSNLSVGELVRRAVGEKLVITKKNKSVRLKTAVLELMEWRKNFLQKKRGFTNDEILKMVREDRKYENGS